MFENNCVENKQPPIKDAIIFMSAYNIHKFKRHHIQWKQKVNSKELLEEFHIKGISHNNTYVAPYAKCNYTAEYNSINQVTAYHFEEDIANIRSEYPDFSDEMMTILSLHHSSIALLDSTQVHISTCFNLESFLVVFDEKTFQVDPIVFMMNGALIVIFELIDFESGIPLEYDSIYGRSHNFGIQPIKKMKYFNVDEFIEDTRTIPEVIFENVCAFLTKINRNKWIVDNYSYVHNTLVLSNKINNVADYFQMVLGAQINDFDPNNISSTDAFEYYSTEYLGVVTHIANDDSNRILFDCIVLESFKVYLLLKMIIDFEINHKLTKIIKNQFYVESLFYPSRVPIITLNMISNIKTTTSFIQYKNAIDFKIKVLNHNQEKQRASNGRLLNILLYILALLGSAQTLQVLQTEFQLPFEYSFWIVLGLFAVFGIIWIIREIKKQ